MAKEPEDKSMESWIWDAACSIHGAVDAPKYKDFILPLILEDEAKATDSKFKAILKRIGV